MKPVEFGDFILLEHMGHGGMASVYRASRHDTGEIVAIKIFKETDDRPIDVVRRLRDREVRMMLAIQHPNVVRFVEAGDWTEKYFYTMEFVDFSLLKLMKSGRPLSLTQKVSLLLQTATGLRAIHNQGIVHRDVKPGNILLTPDGETHNGEETEQKYMVKITDLGIAKNVSETDVVTTVSSKKIPGTPKYLSPEQIELKPVDGRADIFSFGVVAYEMFTGDTPFQAATSDEFMKANVEQQEKPLSEVCPDVPPFLSDIVSKMLAKDREVRYDSDTLERDLTLVEAHLTTRAELMEHTNPNSIFYVPPPPTPGGHRARRHGRAVSPVSWAAVLVILLVAVALAYQQWPQMPTPGEAVHVPEDVVPPAPSAAEALERAEKLKDTPGGAWKAFDLLKGVEPDLLPADMRARYATALRQVENTVAAPLVAHTLALVAQDSLTTERLREAEANLRNLRAMFPLCTGLGKISSAIDARRKERASLSDLKRVVSEARKLQKAGKYSQAADAWIDFMGEGAQGLSAETGKQELAKVMSAWGPALVKGAVSRAALSQYEKAVSAARKLKDPPKFKDHLAEANMKFADGLVAAGDLDAAADAYQHIVNTFRGTDEARAAALKRNRVVSQLRSRPVPPLVFARAIGRQGYSADLWEKRAPRGATVAASRTELKMTVRGGPKRMRAEYGTVRPAENVGFELTVPIQVAWRKAREAGAQVRAGIEITDQRGAVVRIYLDQYGYLMEQFLGEKPYGAKQIAAPMAPEKLDEGHTIKFRYDYIEESCELRVDGKKGRPVDLRLGRVKITLFVQIEGEGTTAATFGKITCVPVE